MSVSNLETTSTRKKRPPRERAIRADLKLPAHCIGHAERWTGGRARVSLDELIEELAPLYPAVAYDEQQLFEQMNHDVFVKILEDVLRCGWANHRQGVTPMPDYREASRRVRWLFWSLNEDYPPAEVDEWIRANLDELGLSEAELARLSDRGLVG